MTYSIIFEGDSLELPQLNFTIAEKLEKADVVNSSKLKDKCKAMYEVVSEILGRNVTEELLGTFNDVEPNRLQILFLEIKNAYDSPIVAYKSEKVLDTLSDARLDKMISLINMVNSVKK